MERKILGGGVCWKLHRSVGEAREKVGMDAKLGVSVSLRCKSSGERGASAAAGGAAAAEAAAQADERRRTICNAQAGKGHDVGCLCQMASLAGARDTAKAGGAYF